MRDAAGRFVLFQTPIVAVGSLKGGRRTCEDCRVKDGARVVDQLRECVSGCETHACGEPPLQAALKRVVGRMAHIVAVECYGCKARIRPQQLLPGNCRPANRRRFRYLTEVGIVDLLSQGGAKGELLCGELV